MLDLAFVVLVVSIVVIVAGMFIYDKVTTKFDGKDTE